jgi:tetratricopeptide (TPR) repeat protein
MMPSNTIEKIKIAFELEKYSQTLSMCHQEIASGEDDLHEIYSYLILSFINLKEYQKAHNSIEEALKLFPSGSDFLYYKALVLYYENQTTDALELINKALSLYPNSCSYLILKGQILVELNDWKNANHSIISALQIEPNNPQALCELAIIYTYLENPIGACRIIKNVLRQNPYDTLALTLNAQICAPSLKKSGKIYRSILTNDPHHINSHEEYQSIKNFYRITSVFLGVFFLFALMIKTSLITTYDSFYAGIVLALFSPYLVRDKKLTFGVIFLTFLVLTDNVWESKDYFLYGMLSGMWLLYALSLRGLFEWMRMKIKG